MGGGWGGCGGRILIQISLKLDPEVQLKIRYHCPSYDSALNTCKFTSAYHICIIGPQCLKILHTGSISQGRVRNITVNLSVR